MLSFKPGFSPSSVTFIKRLFSSSSLSDIRVVKSEYLKLLIYLPVILIPACASSSLAFHMMYSAYKLNKQVKTVKYTVFTYSFPNFEPVCCCMSSSNCCFLTYIQVSQEAGKVIWNSHLLKNFSQFAVIHIVKDFNIINEAVDVFLEFCCCFFSMIQQILVVRSLVPLPFLNPTGTSGSHTVEA